LNHWCCIACCFYMHSIKSSSWSDPYSLSSKLRITASHRWWSGKWWNITIELLFYSLEFDWFDYTRDQCSLYWFFHLGYFLHPMLTSVLRVTRCFGTLCCR
jgi:hypothetical protein